MTRPVVPLTPEATEALRAFTREAVRKGAAPILVRPARQQALFPADGLPLLERKEEPKPE